MYDLEQVDMVIFGNSGKIELFQLYASQCSDVSYISDKDNYNSGDQISLFIYCDMGCFYGYKNFGKLAQAKPLEQADDSSPSERVKS